MQHSRSKSREKHTYKNFFFLRKMENAKDTTKYLKLTWQWMWTVTQQVVKLFFFFFFFIGTGYQKHLLRLFPRVHSPLGKEFPASAPRVIQGLLNSKVSDSTFSQKLLYFERSSSTPPNVMSFQLSTYDLRMRQRVFFFFFFIGRQRVW